MPRPCKRRCVCGLPACASFGPRGAAGDSGDTITMTVDEFETVRLMDLEALTQEECALRMNVARTTVQAIYHSARVKLAECIVCQRVLRIAGGDYVLCDGQTGGCRCARQSNAPVDGKEPLMKIAVTYENGQVFQHFGHTAQFAVYDVADGKVLQKTILNADGEGHGALAGLLHGQHVDALICGGIGGGARIALEQAGIRLYGGVSGNVDDAVQSLLAGTLAYRTDATCSHHHAHDEGHDCGHGACGSTGDAHTGCRHGHCGGEN